MSEDEAQPDREALPPGDGAAFERVYVRHFGAVRGFLRSFVGQAAASEELAQDTFLQLWRAPGRFVPGRSTIKSYLLGIARKKAVDWWRRAPPPSRELAGERAAAEQMDRPVLSQILDQLPPDLRSLLWLREVEGYSYDELAQVFGIPKGTVRSRLFTARECIRQIWHSGEKTR